ncbi:NUDIX domain-containing protein [Actinomadura sp. 9N215]|uniref:NUDIX domain-containing protein n=1 Tax=Actinomadura sp. 9N215 TaxID=3375150 RepID=UPI00379A6497
MLGPLRDLLDGHARVRQHGDETVAHLPRPRHSVSVSGIVVRDDERVLALKRADDGRWAPPGGVLELDETPFEGVVREVFEETGVKVEPDRLTGVYKNMRQVWSPWPFSVGQSVGSLTRQTERPRSPGFCRPRRPR